MDMKTLKFFSVLLLGFLFVECSTTEPTTGGSSVSLHDAYAVLDTTASVFLRLANANNGNPAVAMQKTMWYLREEPKVAEVYVLDSTLMEIELQSGIKMGFRFVLTDDAGNAIYRGGGAGANEPTHTDALATFSHDDPEPLANHNITNKKVLFYAADTKTLPQVNIQINKWTNLLSKSDLGFEITTMRDAQCTEEVIKSFKDYGLVIMDCHGYEDAFLSGLSISKSLLTGDEAAIKEAVNEKSPGLYDRITAGDFKIGFDIKANSSSVGWEKDAKIPEAITLFYTAKAMNKLPQMPNTIIFGNMCYSGWIAQTYTIPGEKWVKRNGDTATTPDRTIKVDAIGKSFVDRGLISYYGYTRDLPYPGTSRAVPDDFAGNMESALLGRLVNSRDSTEIAHLQSNTNKEYFDPEHKDYNLEGKLFMRQYGKKDYSYSSCIPEFTDARDGQKYKAVCIGTQTWMAENLRYNAPGSIVYEGLDVSRYGRLYDWPTVMSNSVANDKLPSGVQGICPKGWHVPSRSEWELLSNTVAPTTNPSWMVSGQPLKATTDWDPIDKGATDKFGFHALPGGFFWTDSSYYIGKGSEAHWWSTSAAPGAKEADTYLDAFIGTGASLTYFGVHEWSNYRDKKSCRCLQDK